LEPLAERKGIFHRAEVMKLKNEVLREIFLIFPHNLADADITQAKFMAAK